MVWAARVVQVERAEPEPAESIQVTKEVLEAAAAMAAPEVVEEAAPVAMADPQSEPHSYQWDRTRAALPTTAPCFTRAAPAPLAAVARVLYRVRGNAPAAREIAALRAWLRIRTITEETMRNLASE